MELLLIAMITLPFVSAIACCIVKNTKVLGGLAVGTSAAVLALSLVMCGNDVSVEIPVVGGLKFEYSGFSAVYGVITAFVWCIATCFMPANIKHKPARFHFFTFLTYGGTLGMLFATDLVTAFVCFEIMSFASYMWIVQDESDASLKAGNTTLIITIVGGFAVLMGIMILSVTAGTLEIKQLANALEGADAGVVLAAGICMLVGFGAKSGAVPLHFWLPKAYTSAPAPATALFSSILSKTGLFGMIILTANVFSGNPVWGDILLAVGVITMVFGGLKAIVSTDLKEISACSSISQIGFIIIGIAMITLTGEHNSYASGGVMVYMINHSFMKLVLLLCVGMVFAHTGKTNLNDVKGFGRGKPLFAVCFAVAGLGTAGVPPLSGYIGKTLVHDSILEYGHAGGDAGFVEVLFLVSGGITLAYVLKMFMALFVNRGEGEGHPLKGYGCALLTLPVAIIVAGGIFPEEVVEPIVNMSAGYLGMHGQLHGHYYTAEALLSAGISMAIGVALYVVFVRRVTARGGVYKKPFGCNYDRIEKKHGGYVSLQVMVGGVCKFFAETMFKIIGCTLDFMFTVIFKAFADGLDALVYLLRKTLFRPNKERHIPTAMELTQKQSKIEARRIIFGNLSFGLFMAGIGLFITVMYVLVSTIALGN